MRIFKSREFNQWAAKEGLTDEALREAICEMEHGLVEADLGGRVFKKRVAMDGRGKSRGVRTLIVYRAGSMAFFIYGFAKNVRSNIRPNELKGLKAYAKVLLSYSNEELYTAVERGVLIEVDTSEQVNPECSA